MRNVISVDVEDYFHPTEVQARVDPARWDSLPSRVEGTTQRVLELFAAHRVTGTFFILGWVAHRCPRLIREILAAGHEIGCHGYWHRLIYDLTPDKFRDDTRTAQRAIADACGVMPRAYRACSFSITERSTWALDILAECGFTHDSSIYPISHDRYGMPKFGRNAREIQTASGPIYEVPIATVALDNGKIAPVGGGAYLRLLPYRYTAAGIRKLNTDENTPACVYFHPWELDAHQPRLIRGVVAGLRTYGGLGSMAWKINRLLSDFRFTTLTDSFPAPSAPADSLNALARALDNETPRTRVTSGGQVAVGSVRLPTSAR